MNKTVIPTHEPFFKGNEIKYIKKSINSTWVSSSGKFVNLFEKKISQYTGAKYSIACVNGTSALQISLKLVGVEQDHEVIVPTITFIAPINAIKYNGANPIFMDVDKFFNLDIEKTIDFINKETFFKNNTTYNKKTKKKISAIIPVHVWGNAVDLEYLLKLCKKRNISIIEDASESLGTKYTKGFLKKKHTGTIGKLGCISFNGNKIITTGGGGMIITNNKTLAARAKYLTTQAKDDPIYFKHNEIGFNFRLSSIQAALGLAQIEKLENFIKKKRTIYKIYKEQVSKVDGISIIDPPSYARCNHWLNILSINKKIFLKDKKKIINNLKKNLIQATHIWMPNHIQKPYRKCQTFKISRATKLVENSICLPSSVNLSKANIKRIISKICE